MSDSAIEMSSELRSSIVGEAPLDEDSLLNNFNLRMKQINFECTNMQTRLDIGGGFPNPDAQQTQQSINMIRSKKLNQLIDDVLGETQEDSKKDEPFLDAIQRPGSDPFEFRSDPT